MSSALSVPPSTTSPTSPHSPSTTRTTRATSFSSITSLPLELIEQIIIFTTLSGHPTTVSALARTCRFLRECVYQPCHSHLWMRMFLGCWDDPRGGRGWRIEYGEHEVGNGTGEVVEAGSSGKGKGQEKDKGKGKGKGRASTSSETGSVLRVDEFPWEEEYKRRIWTGIFLRRHASRLENHAHPNDQASTTDNDVDSPIIGRRATLRSSSLATRHSPPSPSKAKSKGKGKSKATSAGPSTPSTSRLASTTTTASTQPITSTDLTTALQCLLSVLSTSLPLPSPSSLSSFTSSTVPDLRTPYPVFPPHSMSIVGQMLQQSHPFSQVPLSAHDPTSHSVSGSSSTSPSTPHTHPTTGPTSTFTPSLNLLWLTPLIRHAITIMAPRALSIYEEDGVGLTLARPPRTEDELFWRLIAQTGLMEGFGDADADVSGHSFSGDNGSASGSSGRSGGVAEGSSSNNDIDTDMDSEPEDNDENDEDGDGSTYANVEQEPEQEEQDEETLAGQYEFNASSHPSSSSSSTHAFSYEEARRLARIKVYNMRYLHPQRLWGPYVHLRDPGVLMFSGEGALEGRTHVWVDGGEDDDDDDGADAGGDVNEDVDEDGVEHGEERQEGEGEGEDGAGGSGAQAGHTHSLQLIELEEIDEEDVEDPDYVDPTDMFELHDEDEDPMEHDSDASTSSSQQNDHDSPTEPGEPSSGATDSKRKSVTAMDLRFDWNWLSAARQVVEGNLRDLLLKRHVKALRALVGLDGLRMGSAPGMDVERMLREREQERRRASSVEGSNVGEEDGKWDWAGVEGQWRRCVCWIDYRDLIANNVQLITERFDDPDLFEVMRIIPFTLRITSFGTVPLNSKWPHRPPINVVGQLAGSSNQLSDGLRVRGRVEMVGDGNVRWSLRTRREDDEGEWQSEGVQLGGLGSATGVLGMWTSAEHGHMDPLGTFWSWKVGSKDALDEQGKMLPLS